jgi:NAD(P)-dependent dehydrogenase (short-subunit alcohol dehydrogenase family)
MTTIPDAYAPPPDLLADRIILITGAGDGLGRAISIGCARHGATVILLGRTPIKLEAVYDEIEAGGGPQPAIYPLNLEGASPHDYSELAETLNREFGSLHGLVHNAAMLGTLTPIEHYDFAIWHQVMQVNVNAPFMLTRACLPLLRRADDASIVFVSDAVGRIGKPYWGAYGVSKAALEGLMRTLDAELGPDSPVRVNSFYPGPARTHLRVTAYPGEDPAKWPNPDTHTSAFLFLLGGDSKHVRGMAL